MNPILHVCAAGNDGLNVDVTASSRPRFDLDNIISVAATDWNDEYADFSSWGAETGRTWPRTRRHRA